MVNHNCGVSFSKMYGFVVKLWFFDSLLSLKDRSVFTKGLVNIVPRNVPHFQVDCRSKINIIFSGQDRDSFKGK